MLSNFCKDSAVQYLKTIVDCNRCGLCDKLDGTRLRFACGHSACADCVATDCPTCTPLMDPSVSQPRPDEPRTQQVRRASELLTSFQDTFHIDVYQQQRISEHLKVEKELFPECIQAPSKYFNKRKSLHVSRNNKENQSSMLFPGEEISSSKKVTMNKSKSYVQDWLKRSPFSDLKVNTHNIQATAQSDTLKAKLKQNAGKVPVKTNRKRPRLKQSLSDTQSNLENYLKPVEKGKRKTGWVDAKRLKKQPDVAARQSVATKQDKNKCDESGIVIDDECFMIEDTQDQVVDKDRLALLAVASADNQGSDSEIAIEDAQIPDLKEPCDTQKDILFNKVPFYRKSLLFRDCTLCNENDVVNLSKPQTCDHVDSDSNKFDNISISVENKFFITTINVVDSKSDGKQSTAVQTDVEEPFKGFAGQQGQAAKLITKIQDYIQSEAMFSEDMDAERDSQKTSCATEEFGKNEISSSMKDTELTTHRDEHARGVLSNIGAGLHNKRKKGARPISPDSNNSSDKENCDPNRQKKCSGKKKKKGK